MRHPERSASESPPPPPPPRALTPERTEAKWNNRMTKENRLLSDLWLMSAATFRRHGKIEQAKGAIQEGEVKDEDNPAVWVQVSLAYIYHIYISDQKCSIAWFVLQNTWARSGCNRCIPQSTLYISRRRLCNHTLVPSVSVAVPITKFQPKK